MGTHASWGLFHAFMYIIIYFSIDSWVKRFFGRDTPIFVLHTYILPMLLGFNLSKSVIDYIK